RAASLQPRMVSSVVQMRRVPRDHSNFRKSRIAFALKLDKNRALARTALSRLAASVASNAAITSRGEKQGWGHAFPVASGVLAHRRAGVVAKRRYAAVAEVAGRRVRGGVGREGHGLGPAELL